MSENNTTPKWQIWLLARLPRPVVVGVIVAVYFAGMLAAAGSILVMGYLLALAVQLAMSGDLLLIGLIGCFLISLAVLYHDLNKVLPSREKGKGDEDDA
jgi:hypothetical protein